MYKVVLASLLTCATIASGLPSASAQTPVQLGTAGSQPITMPDAEASIYNNAMTQTTPQAKTAAIEAYLTAYPQSSVKLATLVYLMATYSQYDAPKTLDAAERVLQLDPNNLKALVFEAYLHKSGADAITDPAAKQAALDAAAAAAQKGIAAPKPADLSDADFKTLQGTAYPIFYGAIGTAALNKKDTATAIDSFQKELAAVPVDQTTKPGPVLQDTYFLALAYLQSTPKDLLNCAFYASRFVAFAPEPFKSQIAPTAKYCYNTYHGGPDGYDAVVATAQANLNPPADFAASIKPAPTPAEKIHGFITGTSDLATLATSDKEMVFQFGSAEDAGKVWDSIKGKSVEIPGAVVIASTPTQIQAAVSDDAIQSKTADFTFNLAPVDDSKLPAAAAKKKADQMAAATAVGSKVTLTGTYASFTPNPLMITMSDSSVVLAKGPAAKPAPKAAGKAPVRRAAHK